MSSAWIFQELADVNKLGADKAPWQCGWYEPNGRRKKKSFGPGFMGKKRAERFQNQVENQLMDGSYQVNVKKLWPEFVAEYEHRVLAGKAVRTREEALAALAAFERIVKPLRVLAVTTQEIDDYIAARRQEPGRYGQTVSPATINKSLRHLKTALRKAKKWGYLHQVPDMEMQREPEKLPTYISPEHFNLLYAACEGHSRWPENQPYPAADWWRALLVTGYMTGWRIGQLLAVKRADVDLGAGTAITRHTGNKGKRDQLIPLHPLIVEHLCKLVSFDERVFPWNHGRHHIFDEFNRLQDAAGVRPTGKRHYGFHDLRRAFATLNADKMTADALQALMQHRDYQTTQRYIHMARQLTPAVQNLYVPDLACKVAANG
jgi:integrase